MCQLREHLARIFFPAHCTCMNFFWHDGLVQEFFSYAYAVEDIFFQNHPPPPPPPSEVEWSAPKETTSPFVEWRVMSENIEVQYMVNTWYWPCIRRRTVYVHPGLLTLSRQLHDILNSLLIAQCHALCTPCDFGHLANN